MGDGTKEYEKADAQEGRHWSLIRPQLELEKV